MSILQLYIDKADQWRWRLKTDDQKIVGVSGMGFDSKKECIRQVEQVIKYARDAIVEESQE